MSEISEIYHIGGKGKMTRKEVSEAVSLFIAHVNVSRWILLDMYERDAHEAAGFSRWEDFCAEVLGLFHSKSYHSQLLSAARVERTISGESLDISKLSEIKRPKIPINAALEIAKLADPNDQRAAWQEYLSVRQTETGNEGQMARELKNIVARRQKQIPPAPPTPTEEPPTKPDFFTTPVPTQSPAATPAAPPSSPRSPVTSFTPPADPEPIEEKLFEIDFAEAKLVLETVLAWVENEEIDCAIKVRMNAASTLTELAEWIEASVK